MTSNNSNINVETKTNTLYKITTTQSICSEFILGYSYKMLKIYLKKKKKQEDSTINVILQTVNANKNYC